MNDFKLFKFRVLGWTILLLALIFLMPLCVKADDWTPDDTKRQIAASIAIALDWGTTRNFTKRYEEGYYEKWSPMLIGSHPSTSRVDTVMSLWMVSNYFIARNLNKSDRKLFQYITIGVHSAATINNYSIGLRVDF